MNGEEGSTASTAMRLPRARNAWTSALVTVDLPTPGAPVRPITRVPACAGLRPSIVQRARGSPFSTQEMTLARARLSSALIRAAKSPDRGAAAFRDMSSGPQRHEGPGGAADWKQNLPVAQCLPL